MVYRCKSQEEAICFAQQQMDMADPFNSRKYRIVARFCNASMSSVLFHFNREESPMEFIKWSILCGSLLGVFELNIRTEYCFCFDIVFEPNNTYAFYT